MGINTIESLQYDFEIVKAATDDFSESNKLGEGGFGPVYKVIKKTFFVFLDQFYMRNKYLRYT